MAHRPAHDRRVQQGRDDQERDRGPAALTLSGARRERGAGQPPRARRALPLLAEALLLLYAAALLCIGLTRDWRLLHEDNGAFHTAFALSHLELGLAKTRAHDLFYNPHTGEATRYGHHPPATGLAVAAAFALTGSDAPWAARSVPIAFQLASLTLFVALLRIHLPPGAALLGGFFFATLPMGAYFGRMVNYEPLCLTGILLQLYGFARFKAHGARSGLALLALGIAFGGFVDWPAFFFAAALGLVELVAALRGERAAWRSFAFIAASATAMLLIDVVHLWFAAGSVDALVRVVADRPAGEPVTVGAFVARELEFDRQYFSRTAMVASLLLIVALATRRWPLARPLEAAQHPAVFARWLAASILAPFAYTVSAPAWAVIHAYWRFYDLPFVCTALALLVLLLREEIATRGRRARVYAVVLSIVALDIGLTSVRILVKRHTHAEDYAIRQTQLFRDVLLTPKSWHPAAAGTTPAPDQDTGGKQ